MGDSKKIPWKLIWGVTVLVCLIIVARGYDIGQYIGLLRDWVEAQGTVGVLSFLAIYVISVVLMIPASPLSILAGTLFGGLWGSVFVSCAATLGACLAFLVSRTWARPYVKEKFAHQKHFITLEKMTDRYGSWMIAVTRLVPLFPFNLLNYGFGLTNVSFWAYAFWSWLCMIPGIVLYVAGADALTNLIENGTFSVGHIIGLVLLLMGMVIAGVVLKKRFKVEE